MADSCTSVLRVLAVLLALGTTPVIVLRLLHVDEKPTREIETDKEKKELGIIVYFPDDTRTRCPLATPTNPTYNEELCLWKKFILIFNLIQIYASIGGKINCYFLYSSSFFIIITSFFLYRDAW